MLRCTYLLGRIQIAATILDECMESEVVGPRPPHKYLDDIRNYGA